MNLDNLVTLLSILSDTVTIFPFVITKGGVLRQCNILLFSKFLPCTSLSPDLVSIDDSYLTLLSVLRLSFLEGADSLVCKMSHSGFMFLRFLMIRFKLWIFSNNIL